MTIAVLTAPARPHLEHRLPADIEPLWFENTDQLLELAPRAEIGWFDCFGEGAAMVEAIQRAENLRWLTTSAAGVNHLPLALMARRGIVLTNGAGLHASAVAEYALLGMLAMAKGYREVVRAQDRREWLAQPPGTDELAGSAALVIGAGAIGGHVAHLLAAFGVSATQVRRSGAPGTLGPNEWRARLHAFDWVVVAVPSTPQTHGLFGAAELAAMKRGARILNFARGDVIDTDALLAAIDDGHLGGAFLDVTDPEPLPPEHALWQRENVHLSMHLSGRSQRNVWPKGAERFLANLERFEAGEPLEHMVDLNAGY